jgi:hypothetical protein
VALIMPCGTLLLIEFEKKAPKIGWKYLTREYKKINLK